MSDSLKIFSTAGRTETATERCDLQCQWCAACRGRDIPEERLRETWSSTLPQGTPVLRVHGGDPFRYGDLLGWVGWARRMPDLKIVIEGPAASLAGPHRAAVIE